MGFAFSDDSGHKFEELYDFVTKIVAKETGNVFGPNQKAMVLGRIQKRMIELNMQEPNVYLTFINEHRVKEIPLLVGLLTTHHTFFFREFVHFEFLEKKLPEIVRNAESRGEKIIRIFSAACSRGHEVYSLSMFLDYQFKKNYSHMKYKIVGSDIDHQSIAYAKNGVYPFSEVISIPKMYLNGNWQRGTGDIAQFAKIKPHIQAPCEFKVMNLIDKNCYSKEKYDLIFCRNVFIYFDTPTIEHVCSILKEFIWPGGFLITALSESLKHTKVPIYSVGPNVYVFDNPALTAVPVTVKTPIPAAPGKRPTTTVVHGPPVAPASFHPAPMGEAPRAPIRILCVDDSPSILKLLTRMFNDDPEFKLVGTAENGIKAQEFLKKNQVDAMTLDIHMPEMDGVEYLKKNFGPKHPPVIVVSSASREDTAYAQKTLEYGACDFVEKPALNNLAQRADEIKMKIKTALMDDKRDKPTDFDKEFKRDFEIQKPESKARVLWANFSDVKRIKDYLGSLKGKQPPVFLFFEGNNNFLNIIKAELKNHTTSMVKLASEAGDRFDIDTVYLCDLDKDFETILMKKAWARTSISVMGLPTKSFENKILTLKDTQLLLEDVKDLRSSLKEVATDLFPWTSFAHVGTEYLSRE